MKKPNTWPEDLDGWLVATGVKGVVFCATVGVSESTLSQWRHGWRVPTPKHVAAVEVATGGAVRARCPYCGHEEAVDAPR